MPKTHGTAEQNAALFRRLFGDEEVMFLVQRGSELKSRAVELGKRVIEYHCKAMAAYERGELGQPLSLGDVASGVSHYVGLGQRQILNYCKVVQNIPEDYRDEFPGGLTLMIEAAKLRGTYRGVPIAVLALELANHYFAENGRMPSVTRFRQLIAQARLADLSSTVRPVYDVREAGADVEVEAAEAVGDDISTAAKEVDYGRVRVVYDELGVTVSYAKEDVVVNWDKFAPALEAARAVIDILDGDGVGESLPPIARRVSGGLLRAAWAVINYYNTVKPASDKLREMMEASHDNEAQV